MAGGIITGLGAAAIAAFPREIRLPGGMAGEGPIVAGEPLTGQVAHHDGGRL
jgi:hypothetical protein